MSAVEVAETVIEPAVTINGCMSQSLGLARTLTSCGAVALGVGVGLGSPEPYEPHPVSAVRTATLATLIAIPFRERFTVTP